MENRKALLTIFFMALVVLSLVLTGCDMLNKKLGLEPDNILEETAEAVIEVKTGLHLDLTPSTPEK